VWTVSTLSLCSVSIPCTPSTLSQEAFVYFVCPTEIPQPPFEWKYYRCVRRPIINVHQNRRVWTVSTLSLCSFPTHVLPVLSVRKRLCILCVPPKFHNLPSRGNITGSFVHCVLAVRACVSVSPGGGHGVSGDFSSYCSTRGWGRLRTRSPLDTFSSEHCSFVTCLDLFWFPHWFVKILCPWVWFISLTRC